METVTFAIDIEIVEAGSEPAPSGICDDCKDCGCPFDGCPPSCKCECHWGE